MQKSPASAISTVRWYKFEFPLSIEIHWCGGILCSIIKYFVSLLQPLSRFIDYPRRQYVLHRNIVTFHFARCKIIRTKKLVVAINLLFSISIWMAMQSTQFMRQPCVFFFVVFCFVYFPLEHFKPGTPKLHVGYFLFPSSLECGNS